MSADQLGAWLKANKPVALGVAGAGVVGLALVSRNRSGGGSGSAAGIVPAERGYSAGGQAAGVAGTYDSSASDLYSALSPELAGISQSLAKLNESNKTTPTPTPVPAAPKPTAGLAPGFYRKGAESNIYQVNKDGSLDFLTRKEFAAITKGRKAPKVQAISRDHAAWQNGSHWLDKHKQKTTPPLPVPTIQPVSGTRPVT